jgi:hypothetical protein
MRLAFWRVTIWPRKAHLLTNSVLKKDVVKKSSLTMTSAETKPLPPVNRHLPKSQTYFLICVICEICG